MLVKVLVIAAIGLWLALNVVTAMCCTVSQMKLHYFRGCVVAKVATTIFYAPAWVLKGLKIAVVKVIA